MNVTPFHMSKINKIYKILLLKFLGNFTTKTEIKIFKKLLGKTSGICLYRVTTSLL